MRISNTLAILLVLVPGALAWAADPVFDENAIAGVWKTEPSETGDFSHIEVYAADGKFNGRIIYLSTPVYREGEEGGKPGQPRTDFRNPDESLRRRPLLGLDLMRGFEHNGKNKWEDGRIYDPKSGKEYRCKMTMKDADTLEIFGYVKVGFLKLGRDTVWERVAEDPEQEP